MTLRASAMVRSLASAGFQFDAGIVPETVAGRMQQLFQPATAFL